VVPVEQHDPERGQLLQHLNPNGHVEDGEEDLSEGEEATGEDVVDTTSLVPWLAESRSGISRDEKHTKRAWTHAQFHGDCCLPPGYTLMLVPWDAEFDGDTKHTERWRQKPYKGFRRSKNPPAEIVCNSNHVKVAVALSQIVFGVVTIYRTRGDQVQKHGYAAFGLSVTPYVWMSLVNLLGNIMRPSYPALYLTTPSG
jgi:hypothetical protein